MKTLYTTLMIAFAIASNAQEFSTTVSTAKTYPAGYYGSARQAVITSDYQLIHATSDILEIIDLKTGKNVYTWDPAGKYGETWISEDGKFAGSYTQNAKDASGAYKTAFNVLDISSKKEYTKFIPDGWWNKGVFLPNSNEVVVNVYNGETTTASIVLYDFVKGESLKTYFSSTKFSTVVMALAFSKDGSKIYAGIAPNSTTSYINVYDKNTGSVIKKMSLSYQMNKFFISDDYIYVSGESESGVPKTTKYSSSDYSKKAEWDIRIQNMDPTGSYSLLREYKSDMISRVDLTTGKKTDLLNVSSLGKTFEPNGFSPDAKYFFNAVPRVGELKYQGGSKALLVLSNNLIEDNHPITVPVVEEPVIEEAAAWITHSTPNPKFDLDFPGTPKITEGTTSKGRYKMSLKHSATDYVYMLHLVELSRKVKESKYAKVAEDMAETFMEKMDVKESKKSEFTTNGQKGTEYTFTKSKIFYRYRAICIFGVAYQIIYLNSSEDGDVGDIYYDSFKPEQ